MIKLHYIVLKFKLCLLIEQVCYLVNKNVLLSNLRLEVVKNDD